ncbi:MAG: G1 family glutamic endopeptidase [Streptosporangiaceae bacterium]
MVRRLGISAAGLARAAGSLALTGPALAAGSGQHTSVRTVASHGILPGGLFKPAPGTHSAKVHGRSISYSSNWSGYAVTGSTFATATADWTQPAITCTSGDGETDMSPWVGIDGYSSSTVEQTGSSGDCDGATKDYYAWYEMYPRNVVVINKTVEPGDQFTATVTHTTGTSYKLVLEDITQGWTNSVTKSIRAKDSSAEAVEEMAANHLTKWSGTDPFTDFTVDGNPIGSYTGSPYKIEQMEIENGSTVCDSTSALTNEENFTVTWLNAC